MKLYATVTSERASKGQGGNKSIEIDLQVELDNGDRPKIASLNLYRGNGHYLLTLVPRECKEDTGDYKTRRWILENPAQTKGKREKGKTMRQQIREDLREEREHDAFSSGMQ